MNGYKVAEWIIKLIRWLVEWLLVVGAYQLGKDTGDVFVKELSHELLVLVTYSCALLLFIIMSLLTFYGFHYIETYFKNKAKGTLM